MSIRVCGPKSERLINFIARPLVGGMVMNHDDSAFTRHPNPVRGCAESVNWNLKGAGIPRVLTQARPADSRRWRQRWRRWTRDDQRMGNLASQCDASPNTVTLDITPGTRPLCFLPHSPCHLCYDDLAHEYG